MTPCFLLAAMPMDTLTYTTQTQDCLTVMIPHQLTNELHNRQASYTTNITCTAGDMANAEVDVGLLTGPTSDFTICSTNITRNGTESVSEVLNACSASYLFEVAVLVSG